MAGGKETQRSDRMELPKHSDDESERHVFRQVKAVTELRFRLPCCCVNFRLFRNRKNNH
ncbi:MAG: hypothetical protein LBC02_01335 [Planctomycetaceae bacterium]|nr:hypothetical protein [Planctomycetaceae bacterium]